MANGAILTIRREDIRVMTEIATKGSGWEWEVTEKVQGLAAYFAVETACMSVQFTEESLGRFFWERLVKLKGESLGVRRDMKRLAPLCMECYGTGTVLAGDEDARCPACEGGRKDWREYEAGGYARLLHIQELGGFNADMRVSRYVDFLKRSLPEDVRAYIMERGVALLPGIRQLHVDMGNTDGKLPGA